MFDYSRLLASLTSSRIQSSNNALYQTIAGLIRALQEQLGSSDGRFSPTAHATTHYATGTDPVDITLLAGFDTTSTTTFLSEDGTFKLVGSTTGITQLTGDVTAGPGAGSVVSTISNNAVTTVKVLDGNITYAKIQDVSAASRLLGRGDSGSGDVQEITLGTGLSMTGTTLSATGTGSGITELTGDVLAGPGSGSVVSTISTNAVTTTKILDGAVTYAKIQAVTSTTRLLGTGTTGTTVTEISLGSGLTMAGTTLSATGTGSSFPTVTTAVPSVNSTSSANTVVDVTGMSFSLAAGTWLVWGSAVASGPTQTYVAIYITDSADVQQAAGQSSIFVNNSNVGIPIGPFSLTTTSTTTYKMRFIAGTSTTLILKNDSVSTIACTFMSAMQTA